MFLLSSGVPLVRQGDELGSMDGWADSNTHILDNNSPKMRYAEIAVHL